MSQAGEPEREILRERALDHVRRALALCDELSEPVPACHLQHARDLLDPLAPALGDDPARAH